MANAGFSVGTFTGGGTFFVESLSGTLTPVGIVAWGGSGTATRVVPTAAGALPVTLYAGTLNAGTVTVANTGTVVGTVAISTIAAGTVVATAAGTQTVAGTVAISTIAAGTVVANLGATDNAVLDNIDTSLNAIETDAAAIEALLTTIDADTGNIATAVQLIDNAISGTEMQVDVVAALPAGTNNIGDVDILTIAAGTNAIGNVGVIPRTSGGLSIFRSLDLDETEEDVKTSAGQLFGWYIFNAAATTRYVKVYNATAASVTVGSTTPVLTIPVPAGAAANVFSDVGIAFSTAISAAATTGVADSDTGAPSANDVVVNFLYA